MGTSILLTLNRVAIDIGKNHDWQSHGWLFPPSSDQLVPYLYADQHVEHHAALSAPLRRVRERMDLLGYSLDEVRDRYNSILERWNRTYDLNLPFERYLAVLTGINFAGMTDTEQEDFEYDINTLLVKLFEQNDPQPDDGEDFFNDENVDGEEIPLADIGDFIRERVLIHVMLRCLAERSDNLDLPLSWEYRDLVENGWEARHTLMEIDRAESTLNLIRLYGRLQDRSGCASITKFDQWLVSQGVPCTTSYIKQTSTGPKTEIVTLPSAVRNMIHHPENRNQILADHQLAEAIEELVSVALKLP